MPHVTLYTRRLLCLVPGSLIRFLQNVRVHHGLRVVCSELCTPRSPGTPAIAWHWSTHIRNLPPPFVRPVGVPALFAVILWGVSIAFFGFSPWLWLALVLLAIAGWADVISAVMRNTIIMLTVPDELRGRLSALHIANVTGGPRLGDVESGAVAAATDVRVSAWSGGLACVVGVGFVARAYPALRGWRLSEHAPSNG